MERYKRLQLISDIFRTFWVHIRVDTLYTAYVLPVLMYGSEAWTVTKTLAGRMDAFDTRSLRKILLIPYTRHVTNANV